MSLKELFASITGHGRHSARQSTEEGAEIMRRVLELLSAPAPTQEVEASSTHACGENDSTSYCDGRLHYFWSQQGSYAGYPASDRREV
jgi:hypothetical protein